MFLDGIAMYYTRWEVEVLEVGDGSESRGSEKSSAKVLSNKNHKEIYAFP